MFVRVLFMDTAPISIVTQRINLSREHFIEFLSSQKEQAMLFKPRKKIENRQFIVYHVSVSVYTKYRFLPCLLTRENWYITGVAIVCLSLFRSVCSKLLVSLCAAYTTVLS